MNILYCGDINVTEGLFLSALSLKNQTEEPLHLYVLTISLEYEGKTYQPIDRQRMRELEEVLRRKNPDSSVQVFDISSAFLQEVPERNLSTRFTPCCMLRLYADEMPEIPERILYLDTDVLCRKNPSVFYSQPMEGTEMAVVLDNYGRWFFHQKGLKQDYFNSGVLLLNMKEIRKTGLFRNARKICMTKEMFMPDQSALNSLVRFVRYWPRAWNEQRRLHEDTVFQHFTTHFSFWPVFHLVSVKPWQIEEVHSVLKLHEYDDLYKEYASLIQAE